MKKIAEKCPTDELSLQAEKYVTWIDEDGDCDFMILAVCKKMRHRSVAIPDSICYSLKQMQMNDDLNHAKNGPYPQNR